MTLAVLHLPPLLRGQPAIWPLPLFRSLRPRCRNSQKKNSQLISHAPLSRSVLEVIMSNDALSETLVDRIPLFLYVCVFAVCLPRQKAGWASAIRSIYRSSTSQANLTFKSPTHMYWTAVLSPVQIWKREMERGRVKNSEMEKISQPLVTGWGAEKKTAQLSKPP